MRGMETTIQIMGMEMGIYSIKWNIQIGSISRTRPSNNFLLQNFWEIYQAKQPSRKTDTWEEAGASWLGILGSNILRTFCKWNKVVARGPKAVGRVFVDTIHGP